MAKVINQIQIGTVNHALAHSAYGVCSTAAGTAAKTVTISTGGDTTNNAFTLTTGVSVTVKFSNTNSAANPTLNVNSSGAKAIYYNGAAITSSHLKANRAYQFVYDGTNWVMVGDVDSTNFLPLAGGTLTGTLSVSDKATIQTNGYITGTWLRSTADNRIGSNTGAICVQSDGWIYTRTPAQILSDIGAVKATGWTSTYYGYPLIVAASGEIVPAPIPPEKISGSVINFKVNNKSFTALKGMCWEDWLNSEYRPDGCSYSTLAGYTDGCGLRVTAGNEAPYIGWDYAQYVYSFDPIISNHNYVTTA